MINLFAFNWLPRVTVIVFLAGLLWRLWRWQGRVEPARAVRRPAAGFKRFGYILRTLVLNSIAFRQAFDFSRTKWLMLILFHAALLLSFAGHLRIFGFWSLQMIESIAGRALTSFFAERFPPLLGITLLVAVSGLFGYRMLKLRSISRQEDYALFFLLMGAIISGLLLGLSPHTYSEAGYTAAFIPRVLVFRLDWTPPAFLIVSHAVFAQLLVMYLPFSKLLHLITLPVLQVIGGSGESYKTGMDEEWKTRDL